METAEHFRKNKMQKSFPLGFGALTSDFESNKQIKGELNPTLRISSFLLCAKYLNIKKENRRPNTNRNFLFVLEISETIVLKFISGGLVYIFFIIFSRVTANLI